MTTLQATELLQKPVSEAIAAQHRRLAASLAALDEPGPDFAIVTP